METVESAEVSVAVRRDWPDGPHEFVSFTMSPSDASRLVLWSRVRWRRRRFRPTHSVVPIELVELLGHPGLCADGECASPGMAGVDAVQGLLE